MNWDDFQQVARARAVEETDAEARIWDGGARRAATEEAKRVAGSNVLAFLIRRSAALIGRTKEPVESVLGVPAIPGWLVSTGWIAAFGIGWVLSAVGQEREINLLALPLMGILAWNAVVVVLSLVALLRPSNESARGERVEQFFRRISAWKSPSTQDAVARLPQKAPAKFQELTSGTWRARLASRFRAWLHLGAALIAIGSIAGMFARGWSRDYHAVWESTLLESNGASRFLGGLFAPASKVTGIPVPLEKIPGMQRVDGKDALAPVSARDWICLYGATLGLLVVLPRFLLLLMELAHARKISRRALQGAEWQAYARRVLSLVEGAGAPAHVLTHGLPTDAASQDRWRQWAHQHWRDVGHVDFQSVPVAEETEYLESWQPAAPRVLLVFNMSNVPESEIQRELAEGIAAKLHASLSSAPLVVALEDRELRQRWAGFADGEKRLAERLASWRETLNGLPVEWLKMEAGMGSR
ncbi:uncharacterized protein DUF2868 [Roseimicrobium gellanilyticum]|uniref:Uncharacterized protein DUF2868 n=1 Tax=Roseimicrobium gellanilyticum TaxID=748857 RepID=A0A366HSJ1_9BACT|nr:uncharacterized protein DUF2868 [Roseimicrobium gellanilyticum]